MKDNKQEDGNSWTVAALSRVPTLVAGVQTELGQLKGEIEDLTIHADANGVATLNVIRELLKKAEESLDAAAVAAKTFATGNSLLDEAKVAPAGVTY